ncbi:MAG: adenine-specific methyltransferase EcoRI family protein [Brevibacterium aurantiacum]|nr:adenine-specific methyltransferase EcoRI family protein [Brevibacterium aurantiacum]
MTQDKTASAALAATAAPTSAPGKNSKLSSARRALSSARRAKNDEFYTRLEDIENELRHYRQHFRGKTVLLNCDDPETSNFWFFFSRNFDFLGLERLISTHYTGLGSDNPPPSYVLELRRDLSGGAVDPTQPIRTDLKGDGDFRSDECVELLKQSDVVVTNPPFSLFREYVGQLVEHDKKFLVIGNMNAITYKELWPLIERGEMWLGSMPSFMGFKVPASSEPRSTRFWVDEVGQKWRSLGNACWFTNLDHDRRHEKLRLFRKYSPEKYPKYDNYDGINVDKVVDIPVDYDGAMGVPITFLGKHNPEQFEIVGQSRMLARRIEIGGKTPKDFVYHRTDGSFVYPYMRVVIRRKK